MKYCTQCGKELSASAHFCENCGTQYLDPTISPKVQEIEINTANYYNATFPPLDPRGRYIVAHENTIVRNDVCYMQVHFEQPGTLGGNPIRIAIADVSVNMVTGHITTKQKYSKPTPPTQVRTGCIIMLVIGILCWFLTPFISADGYGITAPEILDIYGDFASVSSKTFLFFLAPVFGMFLCLLCEAAQGKATSFVFALLGLLFLFIIFARISDGSNTTDSLRTLSLGFWGPAASFITIIFSPLS